MKTDTLIDMLSTNVEPVDSGWVSRRLAAAIVIGIAIGACLMVLALGPRPDLSSAGALSSFCLKLFFTGVVVVVASVALNKVMRPGGERKVPPIVILSASACSPSLLWPWRPARIGRQCCWAISGSSVWFRFR